MDIGSLFEITVFHEKWMKAMCFSVFCSTQSLQWKKVKEIFSPQWCTYWKTLQENGYVLIVVSELAYLRILWDWFMMSQYSFFQKAWATLFWFEWPLQKYCEISCISFLICHMLKNFLKVPVSGLSKSFENIWRHWMGHLSVCPWAFKSIKL